jgi:septum formation protein
MEGRADRAPGSRDERALVLASNSPRRRELLLAEGLRFDVLAPHADESFPPGADVPSAAVEIARRKASSVAARITGGFVIGADTIVWGEGFVLGKPQDRADARRMLARLAGATHYVTTGFAVAAAPSGPIVTGQATARVTMRPIPSAEIEAYVASGEADDKAGAYGLQGAASRFVTRVEGGRDTVIGLPVQEVLDALAGIGWRRPALVRR